MYANGHVGLKDMSETTANVAPHPTDMLGTNLRRGKGLTFQKGIAKFDGFVQGNAASLSRPSSSAGRQQSARPFSATGRTQRCRWYGAAVYPCGAVLAPLLSSDRI